MCGIGEQGVQNVPNLESMLFLLRHKVSAKLLPVADFFNKIDLHAGIKVTVC